ncbi:MAG: patatin-like phospholipase family protein [Candidatus Omnitrophica bacterium]|nr:patatin-like phospholipase family protein [Candidatus Omnitrophota bacterium]
MNWFRKRRVTVALGGGSARGLANIGVLKILQQHKIPIDLVVGSSMGSLIGAAYSGNIPIEQMEKYAWEFKAQDITDITMPRFAIMKGKKLESKIKELTNNMKYEDCKIPLAITATDIKTGDEVIFTSGDLQKIIKASCSWPGFFPPVKIDGKLLSDGGLRHSVPVKWAKKLGATFTIAVKVGFAPQKIDENNVFQTLFQSFQIMGEELDKYQSLQANVVIEPNLDNVNQLDFDKAREIILIGEVACEREIKRIKSLLRV